MIIWIIDHSNDHNDNTDRDDGNDGNHDYDNDDDNDKNDHNDYNSDQKIMVFQKMSFEEPLFVKNLSFWHLLVYMYTSPNISFFVHCRILSRIDVVRL